MPGDSKTTLSSLTGDAILVAAFERLRPRLLAMILRRVSSKMAARIDPEGVVQDAFVRARPRWQALSPLDRLREVIRGAMGPEHDVDREIGGSHGSAAGLADHLVDSHTGPTTSVSRAERREVVRAALEKLDPIDREILALRYFDSLSFAQIGAILNLKENTANARAVRAAVKFRRLIPPAFRPPGASQS